MCGLVDGDGGAAGALDAMLAAMAGYGAESASWSGAGWAFGVRRWEGGTTPAAASPSQDNGGLAIVAAARLDDRDALCDALGLPPAGRAAHADPELILAAYRRWGRECPGRLLGDYAFAVWDGGKRQLFCARDHIGVQPFYYAQTPWGFAFASAVEGVLAAPGVSGELDEIMVRSHLTGHAITTARTFFQAVRKLPPGHSMVVRGNALRLRRWWRPEELPRLPPASDDDHAAQFLHLYRQAVRDRLHGPDPMGTHLSGGLDSSSVTVLAARELRRQGRPPPLAFSWNTLPHLEKAPLEVRSFQEEERANIAAVARQEGLQVFHESLDAAQTLALLREDVAFPGPLHSHCEIPVQRQAAAHGVRVLLSGWGGDEGVSHFGQGRNAALLLSGRWREFAANIRSVGASPIRSAGRLLTLHSPHGHGLRVAVRRLRKRLRGKPVMFRGAVINPAFARTVRPLAKPTANPVGARRDQLLKLRMGGLAMRMESWAASGARRGLEYRYPLLDRRLLEFALGLPPEQFKRPEASRWLMRHALSPRRPRPRFGAPVLPPQVCWSQTKGTGTLAPRDLLDDSLCEALLQIRGELAAASPSRARYIDMERLSERLDLRRSKGRFPIFEVVHAVQFLDLPSPGRP